jgi:hypothetical protein
MLNKRQMAHHARSMTFVTVENSVLVLSKVKSALAGEDQNAPFGASAGAAAMLD